jgi:hypothetical protein
MRQDRVCSSGCVELRVLARTSQLRARRFGLTRSGLASWLGANGTVCRFHVRQSLLFVSQERAKRLAGRVLEPGERVRVRERVAL